MPYARGVAEESPVTSHSPVAFDTVVAGPEVGEPRPSPDGRFVAAVVADDETPDADDTGRSGTVVRVSRLVVSSLDRSLVDVEWRRAASFAVRSARGLGGGTFDWTPDSTALVVIDRNGDLRLVTLDGTETTLLTADGRELSSPCVAPDGRRVVLTIDQAEIAVVTLDAPGSYERIDGGDHDFVFDPVWWRDRPVWQAWRVPHMPWDESAIVTASGVVAAGPRRQVQQWRVAPNGRDVAWIDDASGWTNVVTGHGHRVSEAAEHAGPQWGERQRSWCWSPDGRTIAFTRNEEGFGRLCTFDVDTGVVTERAKAVHGQLGWTGDTLVALRTGGRTPTQIVAYDTRGAEWTRRSLLVSSSPEWNDHWSLVEPSLVRTRADDGTELFARLYASPVGDGALLCWVHGGPTDQTPVSFQPRFNYWISRGYSILVPDHRGSTGHGRAFTTAMNGRWGEVDSDDIGSIVRDVQTRFGYEPSRTAVVGASAGGLTALAVAATRPELVAACVAVYPVSDIGALENGTHRFEAHYNRSLVGSPAETEVASRRRSPLHRTTELVGTPILLLHGDADPVVPVQQSRDLADAIRRAGGTVEYTEYQGEGHGFRRLDTKRDEYERTERFLVRHLGAPGVASRP